MPSVQSVSAALVNQASSAPVGSVQAAASISVLKQAMQQQANSAMQLLQALPQATLASSGSLGTQVNTYA